MKSLRKPLRDIVPSKNTTRCNIPRSTVGAGKPVNYTVEPEVVCVGIVVVVFLKAQAELGGLFHVINNANNPNTKMIPPAKRLTQASRAGVNFSRKKLTPVLSVSHQAAEPKNTPSTITPAER